MSTKANTVFYSTWTCTLLPNSQLFMYPMDSDVSMYNNLHTICYSSLLEEPLIHDDEDTRRQSILHAVLFAVLWMCPWLPLFKNILEDRAI